MARFFYFLAALIAFALLTLAVLPSVVPRSLLRAELEGALSDLAGYEVRIVGGLEVSFLPQPYLFARRVKLSKDRSLSPAGSFLELEEVEAGLAVIPLLRGEVDFSFLRLVRPVLAVQHFGDDFFNAVGRSRRTVNRFIRFSSVRIEGGTIKYLDLVHGRQIVLRDVNGTLSAQSLSGPLKTQVRFTHQGERYETDISIGRWTKRKVRVKLEARARDRLDTLSLSGSFAEERSTAMLSDFQGRVSVNVKALSRFFSLPKNIKLFDADTHIAAGIDIKGDQIAFDDFLFETEKVRLQGQGRIDLSDEKRSVSLSFNSPYLDLADVFHDRPDESWRAMLLGVDDVARYLTQNKIAFTLSMNVEVFARADRQIENMAFALIVDSDDVVVDVHAVLPGPSALTLAIGRPRNGDVFAGRLDVASNDFSKLSSWVADNKIWLDLPQEKFDLRADLELSHIKARLSKIKARLGEIEIKGAMSVQSKRLIIDGVQVMPPSLGKITGEGVLDWQQGNVGRLRLAGDMSGSAFLLVGTLDAQNVPTEIKAKLSRRDAGILLKQLSHLVSWDIPSSLAGAGEGRVVLRVNGQLKDHFKIAVGARLGDMRYLLKGRGENWISNRLNNRPNNRPNKLTAQIKAKGDRPARLIEAIGLDDIVRASSKDSFMFGGHLSYDAVKGIKVSRLTFRAGKGDLTGEFSLARKGHLWLVKSDLRSVHLPFALFEPKQKEKAWSSRALPLALFKKIQGQAKLVAGDMRFGGLTFDDVRLEVDFLESEVKVKKFRGDFVGGHISATVKLLHQGSAPKFDLRFSARNMNLDRLSQTMLDQRLMSGSLSVSGVLTAQGADPASLIGTLSGAGKITTSAGSFHGFDMALLNRAVPQLGALSHLGVVLGYAFSRGKTDFNKISGTFAVKDGIITSSDLSLFATGVRGKVDLSINLGRRFARSAFLFTLPVREAYPPVGYIVSGSWQDPQKRFNAAGFEQSFASELIKGGINEIKKDEEAKATLPIELLDLLEYAVPTS